MLEKLGALATVTGNAFLLWLYVKAFYDTRTNLAVHLALVRSWLEGPARDGRGWSLDQIEPGHLVRWLDPAQTIFPLVSGPAFIEITTAETLTLGRRTTEALIALNQSIESFNAMLEKAESFRVTHAATLSAVHGFANSHREEWREAIDREHPMRFLGPAVERMEPDTLRIASTLLRVMLSLHLDRIGDPSTDGLCRAWRRAESRLGRRFRALPTPSGVT